MYIGFDTPILVVIVIHVYVVQFQMYIGFDTPIQVVIVIHMYAQFHVLASTET